MRCSYLLLAVALASTLGVGNAQCPSGHTPTCPSSQWSIDGTTEEIIEQDLSGCSWYCKCATCFGCDDGDGNSAADVLFRLSVNSTAANMGILQSRVTDFISGRYEDTLSHSCHVDARKEKREEVKADDETRADKKREVEVLLSEEEKGGWWNNPAPPPPSPCCDALATHNQCSSDCDEFFNEEAASSTSGVATFKSGMNAYAGFGVPTGGIGNIHDLNPRKPCSEWMADLAQAQQEATAALEDWCATAYTQAGHSDALTDDRREDIRSHIASHVESDGYDVSVDAQQHGSNCAYTQVKVKKESAGIEWDLRYDVLLTLKSSSTDLAAYPLLISKVAARKDGPILVRKSMMECGQPRHLMTSGGFGAILALSGGSLDPSESPTSLDDQWNAKLAAVEPVVRGAINQVRFEILGAEFG